MRVEVRRSFVLFSFLQAAIGAAQTGTFSKTLYPVLVKADCRSCHNADGVASTTRLHFPEPDATDRIEAFGRSLVVLVDRNRANESLLLKKPTKRVAHAGGERIKQGSANEAALRAWVNTPAPNSPIEHSGIPEAAIDARTAAAGAQDVTGLPVQTVGR